MILTHHGINSLSRVQLYDLLYADANGKKHFVNPDAIPNPLPAGWELVGDVALLKGNKATIIYKTENTSAKWTSMWLFKVNGLKLDGTDTFVLQQGPASGNTPVEVGTFTATSAATDLDTLVSELDTWLRDNPTATGALTNYNWHAEKHADADGVESCFIVVDNASYQSRWSPIKSSTSGATSPMYMWDWCGFLTDNSQIKRKDGVMTYAVVWNKDRFKDYDNNINNPTDSLTTGGLFNEAGFNATTTVKAYYGTYDNYLDNMVPDEEATTGAFAMFKGKGHEVAEALADIAFPNLSGTSTKVFAAESWAALQKAHSTASVEGLNAGDFFIPSINTMYKIFSALKLDGSDPVNSARVKAGLSALPLSVFRWIPARANFINAWLLNNDGRFGNFYIINSYYATVIAELDLT